MKNCYLVPLAFLLSWNIILNKANTNTKIENSLKAKYFRKSAKLVPDALQTQAQHEIRLLHPTNTSQPLQEVLFTSWDSETVELDCNYDKNVPAIKVPPDKIVKKVWIKCALPVISYAEALRCLKVDVSSLEWLLLDIEGTEFPIRDINLQGLGMKKITIRYNGTSENETEYVPIVVDFLENVTDISELELEGLKIIVNNASFEHSKIQLMTIRRCDINHVSTFWISKFPQLHTLRFTNQPPTIPNKLQGIIDMAYQLKELDITNSFMETINMELVSLRNLERLNVSHNQLHYAIRTVVLPQLKSLDMSYNHIWSSANVASTLVRQKTLEYVWLNNNTLLDICDLEFYVNSRDGYSSNHWPLSERTLTLNNIKLISLKSTQASYLCFNNMEINSLEYFDLSDTRIDILLFDGLPQTKANYTVNLGGSPVKMTKFAKKHYNKLNQRQQQITVLGFNLTISCDCENAWLAKGVREQNLVLEKVRCSNGQNLTEVLPSKLECTKSICDSCMCRKSWSDKKIIAKCNGDYVSLPNITVEGLSEIHMPGSLVSSLQNCTIPDSVIFLDLSRNHLSQVDKRTAEKLFSVTERKFRLAGNPLICDCNNKPFIVILQVYNSQIEDYATITCVDGRPLCEINTENMCVTPEVLSSALVTVGLLVLLAGLTGGLYYRYALVFKMFLYGHGWCLFCVREEELDIDRPYDAFVSFSHKDEQFVVDNLLPELEGEPFNYKLNVHFRDWLPGEMIPKQIDQSVRLSRRTILILSKHFLQSIWGLLEFRTAFISALQEGRSRLIAVVLDDVIDDQGIDDELRDYLNNNTYVKWGDPWFWNKVRYAMPHRRTRLQCVDSKSEAVNNGTGQAKLKRNQHSNMELELEIVNQTF